MRLFASPGISMVFRRNAVVVIVSLAIAYAWWSFTEKQDSQPSRAVISADLPPAPPSTIADDRLNDDEAPEGADQMDMADARRIAIGDFSDLLELLQERMETATEEEIIQLLNLIGEERPEMGIELAQAIGRTDEEKVAWVSDVTKHWARRDPAAAWLWFMRLGPRKLERLRRAALLDVILNEMASNDPKMLVKTAGDVLRLGDRSMSVLPPVMVRKSLDLLVATGNIDLARNAVEEWARNPLKLEIPAPAFQAVALKMADTSQEDAAAWLKSMPPSDGRNSALGTLASHWVWHDPAAAMKWVESLSSEEGRSDAMQRAFNSWVENDASNAGQWLDAHRSELQGNRQADQMVSSLIAMSPLVRSDPQAALQWASLIVTPELRVKAVERILLTWQRTDSASATRYLQNAAELTVQQKNNILQTLRNPQDSMELDP